jgi:hypothetical protein
MTPDDVLTLDTCLSRLDELLRDLETGNAGDVEKRLRNVFTDLVELHDAYNTWEESA